MNILAPGGRRRNVDVRVGLRRARPLQQAFIPFCLVGMVDGEAPPLSERYPELLIRKAEHGRDGMLLEHLRFSRGHDLRKLPGLSDRHPSRLRDAVRLAMAAGQPDVDVVVFQQPGRRPWDLDDPIAAQMLATFLEHMRGALLVLPDAGGPVPVAPAAAPDLDERLQRLARTLRRHASAWADGYHVALVDLPCPDGAIDDAWQTRVHRLVQSAGSADAVLCGWSGHPHQMRAHGWRSAAAAVSGVLGTDVMQVAASINGRDGELGDGRRVHVPQSRRLVRRPSTLPPLRDPTCGLGSALALHEEAPQARVFGEATLRHPLGEWPLPAVRTAKAVHFSLVHAAEPFVFRPVHAIQMLALINAVHLALQPYVASGVLTGPSGSGDPEIGGDVLKDPNAPSLIVTVAASLRPWTRRIELRVNVKVNVSSSVELVA